MTDYACQMLQFLQFTTVVLVLLVVVLVYKLGYRNGHHDSAKEPYGLGIDADALENIILKMLAAKVEAKHDDTGGTDE